MTGSTSREYDGAAMEIRPIRTDADYRAALREAERFWDAEPGTLEGDWMEVLSTLIEAYEAKHYPIPAPDPISAVLFMMEQKGLSRRDLEPAIGSRSRVSDILNRGRPLTLSMVRALSALLNTPIDVLVQPYHTRSAA
jgi:HTH-type transcriptional regulator / antitoxin HigA